MYIQLLQMYNKVAVSAATVLIHMYSYEYMYNNINSHFAKALTKHKPQHKAFEIIL